MQLSNIKEFITRFKDAEGDSMFAAYLYDGGIRFGYVGDGPMMNVPSGHPAHVYLMNGDPIDSERIANEGFIGTAIQRRSVLELARMIGYELAPGVASSAHLAFSVEDAGRDIRSVAFSPDGKRLAVAGRFEGSQHTVRICDVETQREVRRLSGHADAIFRVVFHPDGKQLATVSADRTAKIWDAVSCDLLYTIRGHSDKVGDVAFQPGANRLATASRDATVRIWSITDQDVKRLLTCNGRITDVAISPAIAKRYSPAVGAAGGLVYGATGIAGPIASLWFLSLRLPRDAFVFSVTAIFALNGITQIVVLAIQGLFVPDLLWPALALIPLTLFFVPVGLRIRERVSIPAFERFTMTLLAASAMSIFIRLF